MGTYHTVQQGEHMPQIAEQYGFTSYQTIWSSFENDDLREKRSSPNTLLPGDRVFIPDKQMKQVSLSTGSLHQIRMQKAKVMLRLALLHPDGSPMTDTKCTLKVDGKSEEVSADSQGIVEMKMPAHAQTASLVFDDPAVPFDREVALKIGHLDPVEEVTGQIARLNSLGYNAGSLDPVDRRRLASALEEFQCDNGLTVDGKCGPLTQKKLRELYGC